MSNIFCLYYRRVFLRYKFKKFNWLNQRITFRAKVEKEELKKEEAKFEAGKSLYEICAIELRRTNLLPNVPEAINVMFK